MERICKGTHLCGLWFSVSLLREGRWVKLSERQAFTLANEVLQSLPCRAPRQCVIRERRSTGGDLML